MALTWRTCRQISRPSRPSALRASRVVGVVTMAAALAAGCSSFEGGSATAPSAVLGGSSAGPATVAGIWTGTYRVVECAQPDSGPLANMCTALGVTYPFTLELSQSDQMVTGRYALANLWFELSPAPVVDDRVTLRGTGRIDSAGVQVNVTWSLSVARPSIGGTAVLEWSADAGGAATLRATLVGKVDGQ